MTYVPSSLIKQVFREFACA
jgi:hypothetical protein